MKRILVIGCSGGGKSTLARKLGEKLGLPVVHLDVLFWKPGWVESSYDEFRPKVAAAVAEDRWIVDGNFSRTFDLRLPRADTVVWVDQPRRVCLWRAFRRTLTLFGETRADLAPGCPEKFDPAFYLFIWNFKRTHDAMIEEALARDASHAKQFRLRSDTEIAAFLAAA
ncbi:topology modulation protein [Parvibaculum sp.]|uniref:topology modulation protein n=1 Tax=Parvibaculum sp. TaxID=2024848 RepID=UPI001DDB9CFF|nr:topology modulation protein [Parvibaculum sp.]MBX3490482.1 topology modulation protein [Parvibaculum sp.]MCW5728340.1 topology modulation protein [Parvibaculum sp.]